MTKFIEYATLAVTSISAIAAAWAAIATSSAAKSAKNSAQTSAKQLKTQIEGEAKIERPRLVPLNEKVSTRIYHIFSDWDIESNKRHSNFTANDSISRFSIPIINTGKSFAIDIRYSFFYYGGINGFNDYSNEEIILKLKNPQLKQIDAKSFEFHASHLRHSMIDEVTSTQLIDTKQKIEYISLIESHQLNQINLPKYFIVLCNAYLLKNEFIEQNMNLPTLKLLIKYKDQYNTVHKDTYIMRLSKKSIIRDKSTNHFDLWIDFDFVKPKNPQNKKSLPTKVGD